MIRHIRNILVATHRGSVAPFAFAYPFAFPIVGMYVLGCFVLDPEEVARMAAPAPKACP